jgi:hypothetical protein
MSKEQTIREHIEKLEVLSEIYNDLGKQTYTTKKERDISKLKMRLVKKEMLLLNYLIEKDIDNIASG